LVEVRASEGGHRPSVKAADDPARTAIARTRAAREAAPIQFYKPHPKQALFHQSRSYIKAFLGGNQSGKTTAGVLDDLIQAVDRESLPEHLRPFKRFEPPFLCRIVTPDFTSTMEGVVFEKLKEWVPKDQLRDGAWDKAYDKQLRKLHFANGSWFDFLTYEQDLDKFGGATLDRVHFDEEPPGEKGRKIFHQSRIRVMKRGGDIVFSMTPELGMSWMYDEVYERRDEDDYTVITVANDDNPHISAVERERAYEGMSAEEQAAKRQGLFIHFSGPVLKGFNEDRHLVDRPEPDQLKGQHVVVTIDPGIVRGAVTWTAFDRDNRMLVFDELYPSNEGVESVAQQILAKNREWGLKPAVYLIDPSGRNRSMGQITVMDEFIHAGIPCTPAQNSRQASVLQLRRRITNDALLVSRTCTNWLWESRRWRVARDEITEQDRPTGGDTVSGDTFATTGPDHLMDTTRYAAMERFYGPAPQLGNRQRPRFVPDFEPPWTGEQLKKPGSPMGAFT
jgi:phage terminase large subunit-like protein